MTQATKPAPMANYRPGIDDNFASSGLIVRLNVPLETTREEMIAILQQIAEVQKDKLNPERTLGSFYNADGTKRPRLVVADLRLNLLVGFGLRFFLGPLDKRTANGPEEGVPNFPPGGTFQARFANRFGITDRPVPMYLRTMNAAGDRDVVAGQLKDELGHEPTQDQISQAYTEWLSEGESDLIFQIDCRNQFAVVDLWAALLERVVLPQQLEIVSIERGYTRGDGKAHIGFMDGTSNLQDMMREDPVGYRAKVYLPVPAPAYPGFPLDTRPDPENPKRLLMVRDDMRFDGGSYMVYRKYAFNLSKWFSDDFEVSDFFGCKFKADEARLHAIGRDPTTGKAINRASRCPMHAERDGTEINLAFNESHALKARGGTTTIFSGPFPPVPIGNGNSFNTQDIRIRRRSLPYGDICPRTGRIEWGLHFICFQNNIQQTGFEFINNIWLMNPDFRRSTDGLMNPPGDIVIPRFGSYYFVPPQQHSYPGDCFFG